jgi:nucleoid-associated protein YgaU
MTSDAKIGLLLGLVFIFIIAFIINGLPKLRSTADSDELTYKMANDSVGIADKERLAQESLDSVVPVERAPVGEAAVPGPNDPGIRSIIPVPADIFATREPATGTDTPLLPAPAAERTIVEEPKQVTSVWPKTYVVQTNDNLGDIAKKFYGPEQGNKAASVDRVFQANRNVLSSPDEIYVGQKLVIPAPPAEKKVEEVLPKTMFEKVVSIGRKHLSADAGSAEPGKWYVVREGDSLWKIAADQLGNGSRYKEISRLNANLLNDENSLNTGMRLRLPPR